MSTAQPNPETTVELPPAGVGSVRAAATWFIDGPTLPRHGEALAFAKGFRDHLELLLPLVEQLASQQPAEDVPAGMALAAVEETRTRMSEPEAPGLAGEAARVKRLARSVVAPQETYKIGDTVDIDAAIKTTAGALSFKDPGIAGVPGILQAGMKWAAVEVKVCNKDDGPVTVSPFVWHLAYADGARFAATSVSGGAFPQPLYPVDAKVRGGDCVRGHVLFEVPKEGRAERVLYSPDALDEPVEWQLGK